MRDLHFKRKFHFSLFLIYFIGYFLENEIQTPPFPAPLLHSKNSQNTKRCAMINCFSFLFKKNMKKNFDQLFFYPRIFGDVCKTVLSKSEQLKNISSKGGSALTPPLTAKRLRSFCSHTSTTGSVK